MHRMARPTAIGAACLACLLLAVAVLVAAVQLSMRRRTLPSVVACTDGGCRVMVPALTREQAQDQGQDQDQDKDMDTDTDTDQGQNPRHHQLAHVSIFVPDIGPHFAAYNPSAAVVQRHDGTPLLLGTARVSSYTWCPNSTPLDRARAVENHLVVTLEGRPARVTIPEAMAEALWPAGARNTGLEDARPFALAPGIVGFMATVVLERDAMVPRMCVVVVPFDVDNSYDTAPAPAPAPVTAPETSLHATAVVLLDPTEGQPQKNWMPWVSGNTLWLVKDLAPQTNLTLSLDALLAARGVVTATAEPAFEVRDDAYALRRVDAAKTAPWRGSSPLLRVPGRPDLVAAVHRRRAGLEYDHAFAAFDDFIPFRLARLSQPFHLVADDVGFMYVAGVVADPHDASTVLVTLGGDDCYAMTLLFDVGAVDALLAAGPDAPMLTLPTVGRVTRDTVRAAAVHAY